ncbi:MAG: D-alanyl-D-alanine carboxypeptidase [Oscillospiraceae bacterium]|nr:D-alanyl-D-alanine carboxypeptidase [Oscillospiraceae bacterium]
MKKILYLELAVMAVLVIVAIIVCFTFTNKPALPPDSGEHQKEPSQETTETPTESVTEFVPTWNTYPADRQLLGQQYFVYDCKANTFLILSGQKTDRVYPASITKLFTAYVAMQYVQPDTRITAGSELDMVAWGSSVAKIKKGDTLTAEQLVEAMLLPSGNDASYILACEAGRIIKNDPGLSAASAVAAFMAEMNKQAKDVGMVNTHYVNPDGIHDNNHYTTFEDLAILGKLSMGEETIMRYAATARETVTLHGEEIEWKNTNALVDTTSPYYCPYAVGLKTGQTPSAGSCLLSAFRMDDHELLIGVFGCPEEEDRFDDTLQLLNQIVLN